MSAVPHIIRAAGEDAVRAYHSYFETGIWTRQTRRAYATVARRFFDWAHRRALTLETIDAPAVAAYAVQLTAEKSPQTVASYLAPIRGVLRVLSESGVIDQNPCATRIPIPFAPTAVAAPPPSIPQTPEEWQAAVDAADAALMLDSLMQYGLIESDGPLSVNADRCREILELGRSLGYEPSRDEGTAAHG